MRSLASLRTQAPDGLNSIQAPASDIALMDSICNVCSKPLAAIPNGRPRKFCSGKCRQKHYRIMQLIRARFACSIHRIYG